MGEGKSEVASGAEQPLPCLFMEAAPSSTGPDEQVFGPVALRREGTLLYR